MRTSRVRPPLSSLDDLWAELERAGEGPVLQRIDQSHPGNFYAAIDAHRRKGLILISSAPPHDIPDLENLEIDVQQQQDARWRTSIWLTDTELQTLFSALAQDMVSSSRSLSEDQIAPFIAARILRWGELLESGSRSLQPWELRGRVAELIVLRRLCDLVSRVEAVDAWQGPLGAPQDFVFARSRIEAKAIGPTARRVRITSADQLNVPLGTDLRLVVVMLSDVSPEAPGGFTVADLLSDIRNSLGEHPSALRLFEERLKTAELADVSDYSNVTLRFDGLRSFVVEGTAFPRIVPTMLADGISQVVYQIDLATISDFERAFGE